MWNLDQISFECYNAIKAGLLSPLEIWASTPAPAHQLPVQLF